MVDPVLTKHFKELEEDGTLKDMVMFVLSDHGICYGELFLDTPQG